MALLKTITILTLLMSVTVAWNILPAQTIPGHDLIVGTRLPGDKLIHKENIVKTGKWLRVVEVVKNFNTTRGDKITQIMAKDQISDGTGAYAKITHGGPTYANATIKFTSQRGYGINFLLEIYAR